MVYAIQAFVYFRNAARRDNAQAVLAARFQTGHYGEATVWPVNHKTTGDPGIAAVCRFIQKEDRDSLFADLDAAFGTGINGPVSGSSVRLHDCDHDTVCSPCVISQERNW